MPTNILNVFCTAVARLSKFYYTSPLSLSPRRPARHLSQSVPPSLALSRYPLPPLEIGREEGSLWLLVYTRESLGAKDQI